MHRGPLLTADHVVRSPAERRSLLERYAALAVDMETFAVAEVCRQRQVPFASVRVINDVADETLPRDVEHLLRQKTGAARLGAARARSAAGRRVSRPCTSCTRTRCWPPAGWRGSWRNSLSSDATSVYRRFRAGQPSNPSRPAANKASVPGSGAGVPTTANWLLWSNTAQTVWVAVSTP